MSWLSEQIETRQRFYEKYPNGTQVEWVKFRTDEAMKKTTKEQINEAAQLLIHARF